MNHQKDIILRRLQKIELMGTSGRLSHMVETIYIFLRVMTNELMNLSLVRTVTCVCNCFN